MKNARRKQQPPLGLIAVVLTIILLILLVVAVACGNGNSPGGHETTPSTSAPLCIVPEGAQVITVEFGTDYEDLGAKVYYYDTLIDVQVSVSVPEQMQELGNYTVVYTATYEGYLARAERIVEVVDTTAPEILLLEVPGYCPEIGEQYEEEGFVATDAHDGDLTDKVERIEDGDLIRYRVTDASGNTTQVERTIEYGDTTAPEITLNGETTVTIDAGTEFEDPGCIAIDNVDGDVTDRVTVSGSYDKYLPGSYTYTYTVTDDHGNTATAERTIVVQGVKQAETVQPDGKVIYLTFDDGPSKYTLQLLEVLEKYNVKATFFVVGTARLDLLDEIAAGGHAIGIHSYTHTFSQIYVNEDAFFDDFYKLYYEIYERTGIYTKLSRFPGGGSNTVSRNYCTGIMTRLASSVQALGFRYFDWNVDSKDAGGATTADEVYNNVINGISGRKTAVVLQHDIKSFSVAAVEKIIQWGIANGYTFLSLDETSPTCHHRINN